MADVDSDEEKKSSSGGSSVWQTLEGAGRTIFGIRGIKDPLFHAMGLFPDYIGKVNPAISAGLACKEMVQAFTADNRREGDVHAMQGAIDLVGAIPIAGAVMSGVDACSQVNKLSGGRSLAEWMADAIEPTETDQLDPKNRPQQDQEATA